MRHVLQTGTGWFVGPMVPLGWWPRFPARRTSMTSTTKVHFLSPLCRLTITNTESKKKTVTLNLEINSGCLCCWYRPIFSMTHSNNLKYLKSERFPSLTVCCTFQSIFSVKLLKIMHTHTNVFSHSCCLDFVRVKTSLTVMELINRAFALISLLQEQLRTFFYY